jgi:beta-propeller repeat-containing protein
VGFAVAAYDSTKPLIIDPVLVYSTYLGGSGSDTGGGIAVDAAGNVYVTGFTTSPDFPTTLPPSSSSPSDVFVAKLNPTGSALLSFVYLGGSGSDGGSSIAMDAAGNAYVTGTTESLDFPITPGAFLQTCRIDYNNLCRDAFVAKLSPQGSTLVYSTYLGGSHFDYGYSIAIDTSGNAYVTGTTDSVDFPTTLGVFKPTCPPNSLGLCMDAFIVKLNSTGTTLLYSTYLGGSNYEEGTGIAIDAAGNAYVTGTTTSLDFPTTIGAFQSACSTDALGNCADAFVTKLNPAASTLVYSTFLGGRNFEAGTDIAVDSVANVYVTGNTRSMNFPTTTGVLQLTCQPDKLGFCSDAFISKLNPAGSALVYSSFLGSNESNAIATVNALRPL